MKKENAMGSVNKVMLLGNLGRDPEIRFTPKGTKVANLSVATSRRWKDKTSDDVKEATDWHRVVLWGRLPGVNYFFPSATITLPHLI
jgi:single-strand DNA-binding protein